MLFESLTQKTIAGKKEVVSANPQADSDRLLRRFATRAFRTVPADEDVMALRRVFEKAFASGHSFQDSLIAGYVTALCSPKFIGLEETTGSLTSQEVAVRLSLFLTNSMPDASLRELADARALNDRDRLRIETKRLLSENSSSQFIDSFLAYWLELRRINDTSPDELLYPDYYLDDALVDAALLETQLFFGEVVRENLPVRTLIHSDFTYANERLAKHYGLEPFEGAVLRRVSLPANSPRGGC